jgi:hypothetical protein
MYGTLAWYGNPGTGIIALYIYIEYIQTVHSEDDPTSNTKKSEKRKNRAGKKKYKLLHFYTSHNVLFEYTNTF